MPMQWYPGHMAKARRELAAAIPMQDLVIEVLDARLPRASANPLIAELLGDKPCLRVLTKADLADPAITDAWLRHFARDRRILAAALTTETPKETRSLVAELAQRLAPRKPLRALIAGVPNVGKSTLINTLMNRAVAVVGNKPAVTKGQQQVVLSNGTVLSDTPGIMWPKIDDEDVALRLALAGSIPDTAIDYVIVGTFAARLLLERYPDRLSLRFKLDALPDAPQELLCEIGRRRGCLRSGGVIDLHKASEILVHELRSGGLGRISLEAPLDHVVDGAPGEALDGDQARSLTPPRSTPAA